MCAVHREQALLWSDTEVQQWRLCRSAKGAQRTLNARPGRNVTMVNVFLSCALQRPAVRNLLSAKMGNAPLSAHKVHSVRQTKNAKRTDVFRKRVGITRIAPRCISTTRKLQTNVECTPQESTLQAPHTEQARLHAKYINHFPLKKKRMLQNA
jgi:hypothetical protein